MFVLWDLLISFRILDYSRVIWCRADYSLSSVKKKMALFQTQTPPPIYSHGFSFKTHSYSPVALPYHLPPPSLPLSVSSMKTHHQSSLFSPSTVKRKLLCSPPHGKHVREDYLVVSYSCKCLFTLAF